MTSFKNRKKIGTTLQLAIFANKETKKKKSTRISSRKNMEVN